MNFDPADVPTTLPDFQRRFATEEACAAFLFHLRYPDGYACPDCGSRKAWKVDDLYQMICDHGHRVTVTAGTVMHRSKQPLTTWFYAAYLVSTLTPGISSVQFQRQLGITRNETAFNLLHKLRSALVDPDREPLKGEVEVDEAFIGGPEEGKHGREKGDKALIVVAVEVVRWIAPDPQAPNDPNRGVEKVRSGRARMAVIPDASATTLVPWVQRNVAPGTTVVTDGLQSYNSLAKLGYALVVRPHTRLGVKTGAHLEHADRVISNLKRWLLGTHHGAVLNHHLQAYLNEYCFRFNRRFWRGPAFTRALGLMLHAEDRPEYETLYAVGKGDAGAWVHPNPRPAGSPITVNAIFDTLEEEADPAMSAWLRKHERIVKHSITSAINRGRRPTVPRQRCRVG